MHSVKNALEKWLGDSKYSSSFSEYLKTFDLIFSFNVDGVINKCDLKNVIYSHGYFGNDEYDGIEHNSTFELWKKNTGVAKKDKTILKEFIKEMNRYHLIYIKATSASNSIDKKIKLSYLRVWGPRHTCNTLLKTWSKLVEGYTVNENSPETLVEGYSQIGNINWELVILGFNPKNDKKIFEQINKNQKIDSIKIFCEDKSEIEFFSKIMKGKELVFQPFKVWRKNTDKN